jgi:hexosaminidase
MPNSLQTGNTFLKLLESSPFEITSCDIPQAPQDLLDAIERTRSHLYVDKLQRLIVGRGANDSVALANAPSLARLTLALNHNSPPIKSIMVEATKEITKRSESYSLTIPDTDQGVATLTADSSLGLLRGLTTFEQLWYQVSGTVYSYQAPVQITNDYPAFVRVLILRFYDYLFIYCSCLVSLALSRVHVGYGKKFVGPS